jgi:antitoxin VapB
MAIKAVNIQNVSGTQIIEIPENFRIDDDKVYLKKVGNSLYIIPFHNPWQGMFDSIDRFTDDFMDDRAQTAQQVRTPTDL